MRLYGIGLYLRWASMLAGTVMGIGLIVIGDHAPRVPAVLMTKPGTARDPFALGNVMAASVALGPFPLPSVVAELAAFFATLAAVTVATTVGLPWPLTVLGGALLFMVVSTELWYLVFPGEARKSWSGFAYVGHLEQDRWRSTTGTEPPNTAKKFKEWLRDNVERPETRWAHAEMLAVVGRLDEARAMAQRIEADTPTEVYDRNAMLDYIEWIDGREIDFDARRREADTIGMPGSRERLFARGLAAIALARERARRAATGGRPWRTSLRTGQVGCLIPRRHPPPPHDRHLPGGPGRCRGVHPAINPHAAALKRTLRGLNVLRSRIVNTHWSVVDSRSGGSCQRNGAVGAGAGDRPAAWPDRFSADERRRPTGLPAARRSPGHGARPPRSSSSPTMTAQWAPTLAADSS